MDLIGSLTSQLGLDETQAKGLAGGLMGLVKTGLASQSGEDAAAQLEAEVPEMAAWQSEGDTPPGQPGIGELLGSLGGGGFGEALGGLGGMLGGAAQTAGLAGAVAALVEKFGLDAGKAQIAGQLAANFLSERLGSDLLGKVQPFLGLISGGAGNEDGGGLGGMLGGLLG